MTRLLPAAVISIALACAFSSVAQSQVNPSTGYVVSPSGDTTGVTDSAAIQSDIADCAAAHGCTIYLLGPLYIKNISLVNLYYGGITFVGINSFSNYPSATSTVTVTGTTSRGFDLSGTSGIRFQNLSIRGGASMPISAIYAARTSSSTSSFGHVFEGVSFYGSFSQAAVYDFAGEGWVFSNSTWSLDAGNGGYFTSKNSVGVTSIFDASTSTTPFMTLTTFNNDRILVRGAGAHCLWFEGVANGQGFASYTAVETINIRDTYFNASNTSGSPPGACLVFNDVTGGLNFTGNRDESDAALGTVAYPTFAVFTDSGTNQTHGIGWQGNQFYTHTNIIDASAANIYNITIKNNTAENRLTYLFNNIQIADIGPLTALEHVTATGTDVIGVNIQVAYQALLANISLPINAGGIIGDEHLSSYPAFAGGGAISYTMPDYTQRLFINPTTLAVTAATITTAPHPVDGQKLIISCSAAVPALTIRANTGQSTIGAPTSIPVNGTVSLQYSAGQAAWFRLQ